MPMVYPPVAAVLGAADTATALRLTALAILVAGSSFVGVWISTKACRYFRDSQFWADEAGLLVAIFGFVWPLIALYDPGVVLDRHLLFIVMLAVSCLAGIASILAGAQPRGKSA